MAELNFDSTGIDPIGTFTPLPVGNYKVVIKSTEKKATKSGDGELLQITYEVIDGEYKGRRVFGRLNLVNKNETAEKIGKQNLAAICVVTGVPRPRRTEELHDKPFQIRLIIRPAKDQYQESNDVAEYLFLDGRKLKDVLKTNPTSAAAKEQNAGTPAAASPEGERKRKPWEK